MERPEAFDEWTRLIKDADISAIRAYVENGGEVNARNRFGWTPLMLAALKGHTPVVEYLLSQRAEVAAVNIAGASALCFAALQGHCRVIQVLLDANAPVDAMPHGVSIIRFAEIGSGVNKTQRHFELLRNAGATS